jgi:hypothetical protein
MNETVAVRKEVTFLGQFSEDTSGSRISYPENKVNLKGKNPKLSLCFNKYHAMKTYPLLN